MTHCNCLRIFVKTIMDISNLQTGKFLYEENNRFRGRAIVDNEEVGCYIPSSCKLGQLISIENKPVFLVPFKSRVSDLSFRLFAVKFKSSMIILDSSYANQVVYENISSRIFSFLGSRKQIFKEYTFDGYKSDLFIPATKTVIEIKSIISSEPTAPFLTIKSNRFEKQIEKFQKMSNVNKILIIVALNPFTKRIEILTPHPQQNLLLSAMSKGLKVYGFSIKNPGVKTSLKRVKVHFQGIEI